MRMLPLKLSMQAGGKRPMPQAQMLSGEQNNRCQHACEIQTPMGAWGTLVSSRSPCWHACCLGSTTAKL